MNSTATHKLNVMVDGNRVFEMEYTSFEIMMDAARDIRDGIAIANPGAFIVVQSQEAGPYGWSHLAILS